MKISQTAITEDIKRINDSFRSSRLSRIFEILSWIHHNLKLDLDENYKKEHFRSRTAGEIIESKKLTGCSDYALVFLVLAKASGFKTKYVETIQTEWLRDGGDKILGHVFVEVFLDKEEEWVIIDPQGAVIRAWYGKRYVVYAKGEDSWDIGIKNFDDLKEKFFEYRKKYSIKKRG